MTSRDAPLMIAPMLLAPVSFESTKGGVKYLVLLCGLEC